MTTRVMAYHFLEAVKQGSTARVKQKYLPVLTGVLIHRVNAHVEVISTDLEQVARGTCPAIDRDVLGEETWGIVLPEQVVVGFTNAGNRSVSHHLAIYEWLQALQPKKPTRRNGEWQFQDMTIEFLPRIQTLKVQCGRITATFKGIDAQEFPVIPEEKLNDAQFTADEAKYARKRVRRDNSPEAVLARHAEEAWQKALKATKRMSPEAEVEHWKTWLPLLPEHQAEIESKLAQLAEVIEKQRQWEIEYEAECRQREEQEHIERLETFAWLDPIRESLRAEFNAGLRKDKHVEMNRPVVAWPFRYYEESAEPTYPTSYDWLEAVFICNSGIPIGRQNPKYGWKRGKGKVDTIAGYKVTSKQMQYAELLRRKFREDHPVV